jgi:hypothetical protein
VAGLSPLQQTGSWRWQAAEVQRLEQALAESQLISAATEQRLQEAVVARKEEALAFEGERSVYRSVVAALTQVIKRDWDRAPRIKSCPASSSSSLILVK